VLSRQNNQIFVRKFLRNINNLQKRPEELADAILPTGSSGLPQDVVAQGIGEAATAQGGKSGTTGCCVRFSPEFS
jgi:hypothetical protein